MITNPKFDSEAEQYVNDAVSDENAFKYRTSLIDDWCDWYFDTDDIDAAFWDEIDQYDTFDNIRAPEQFGRQKMNIALEARWLWYWHAEQDDSHVINYGDVQDDWLLRLFFAKNPRQAMAAATRALRAVRGDPHAHVEFSNMPEDPDLNIEDLRAKHINQLVVFDVSVSHRSDRYSFIYRIRGRCTTCDHEEEVWQGKFDGRVDTPEGNNCPHCDGHLQVIEATKDMVSAQEILLQDLHKNTEKSTPDTVPAGMEAEFVESLEAGNEARVAAIVRADDSVGGPRAEFYLQVVGIQDDDKTFEQVDLAEEDIEEIKQTADAYEHELLDEMAASVAPEIIGDNEYTLARQAGMLQLVGGVSRVKGGKRHRGDIHGAFVGDPSTAKSYLADTFADIAPKSVTVSGESTTKVGFTAAAVQKEEFGKSEVVLEGGALVQAEGGLCVIDELDKAPKEHHTALHRPLEQQEVNISKWGITATLSCQSSTLVVANPVDQRFDLHKPLLKQIDMAPALFTRYDFIIPFIDEPDWETDKEIMQSIGGLAAEGEDEDDGPTFDYDYIRKHVAYARRQDPVWTADARDYISEEFADIRALSERHANKLSISNRDGDGMRRLAEASARLRLSDTVDVKDAERAKSIVMGWMKLVAQDQFGELDADMLNAGPDATDREIQNEVLDVIEGLAEANSKTYVPENNLYQALCDEESGKGYPEYRVEAAIDTLKSDQRIWSNDKGLGVMN